MRYLQPCFYRSKNRLLESSRCTFRLLDLYLVLNLHIQVARDGGAWRGEEGGDDVGRRRDMR